jgi:hypothetical protein
MSTFMPKKFYETDTIGLYYKLITIVNDVSKVVSKRHSKLIDNARVIIYNCNMFIIQDTGALIIKGALI